MDKGENMMSKEFIILAISWGISILTLVTFIRGRARLVQITFLFTQALAWIFVYILVFFNLVRFPYREFKTATTMSFSLYYLLFPTVGVLFILFYPKQPTNRKVLLYYLFFAMLIPTYSSLAERYSELFQFIKWNWPIHVVADLMLFYILKKFIFWFRTGLDR
jgi:hypothetical protein